MSVDLRDYFASHALAGMLADHEVNASYEALAESSYKFADAMLKARGPKFTMVRCSSCGCGFGPGNSGFSSCKDHQHLPVVEE